eukprot:7015028-Pyramimonas_sp.AAC.1
MVCYAIPRGPDWLPSGRSLFWSPSAPPWPPPIKAPHLGARLGAPFQQPHWETVSPLPPKSVSGNGF